MDVGGEWKLEAVLMFAVTLCHLNTVLGGGHSDVAHDYSKRDHFRLKAEAILKEVPLIDGHNDWPMNLMSNFGGQLDKVDLNTDICPQYPDPLTSCCTDLVKHKQGMVGGQFWSVFTLCNTQYKDGVQRALEMIDLIKRLNRKYNSQLHMAYSVKDVLDAHRRGKIASLIGLEGGHMISNSMGVLRMFYEVGVRYMTLTWNCNTPWADCNNPEGDEKTKPHGGLSDWGKLLVVEMNRLGMLVDLSHVSPDTMRDVLQLARAPVIFSHSSVYAICPHRRNVPDDVIKKVKENGGVIMVNFFNTFVNCTLENRYDDKYHYADVDTIINHMDYIRDLIGTDYIGIGSDFDGSEYEPVGLEDSSKYPNLVAQMLRRGWSEDDVKKVVGLNLLRVLRKNEQISVKLQWNSGPEETLIPADDIPDKSCVNYPSLLGFESVLQLQDLLSHRCTGGKPCS